MSPVVNLRAKLRHERPAKRRYAVAFLSTGYWYRLIGVVAGIMALLGLHYGELMKAAGCGLVATTAFLILEIRGRRR